MKSIIPPPPPPMKIGVANDVHLNFVKDVHKYRKHVRVGRNMSHGLDALVLCGDISEGPTLKEHLGAFCSEAECPVYFVLGNHDFWHVGPEEVRKFAEGIPNAVFLDSRGVQELSPGVALVGRSGWYDARVGRAVQDIGVYNDREYIQRLKNNECRIDLLVQTCRDWADEEVICLSSGLFEAAETYEQVIVATHMPPYPELALDLDGVSPAADTELPWLTNCAMGALLSEAALLHPKTNFTVVSGHTHVPCTFRPHPNMTCFSGRAKYKHPQLSRTLVF